MEVHATPSYITGLTLSVGSVERTIGFVPVGSEEGLKFTFTSDKPLTGILGYHSGTYINRLGVIRQDMACANSLIEYIPPNNAQLFDTFTENFVDDTESRVEEIRQRNFMMAVASAGIVVIVLFVCFFIVHCRHVAQIKRDNAVMVIESEM